MKKDFSWLYQTAIGVLLLAGIFGCGVGGSSTVSDTCGTTTLQTTYSAGVAPIISASCTSCHSGMGSYNGLKSYVTSGSPSSSLLYTDMYRGSMPPSGALSSDKLNAVCAWIKAGALNN